VRHESLVRAPLPGERQPPAAHEGALSGREPDHLRKMQQSHGHGHNYVVEVLVGGAVNPETGMVVDMVALDEVVRARVIERFDHANLNLTAVCESCADDRESM